MKPRQRQRQRRLVVVGGVGAHELVQALGGAEAQVAVLHGVGGAAGAVGAVRRRPVLDHLVLLLQRLGTAVARRVAVLHPGDAVEVPQAGVELGRRGHVAAVAGAVGAPAALLRVRRRGGVHCDVVRKEALEDAPGLARLQVEDEALVPAGRVLRLESLHQVLGVEVLSVGRHAQHAGAAVVAVVDEHVVVGPAGHDLAAAAAAAAGDERGPVAQQGGEEVVDVDVGARVVLGHPGVDVGAGGVVDDDAWPRVVGAARDVVVHEDDDVLVLETALLHDLPLEPAMRTAHLVPAAEASPSPSDGSRSKSCHRAPATART
ncbi:hypothetical protein U9M48_045059 [Paspalum notatum var. saurae]|uniref:Uncharacterized protein n=1 Tax=Paspalum notatum var. saurae TaxID=547442 RepID=A0AAQ3UWH9_PASNO